MDARHNNFSFYKNCLQERVGSTDCFNDLISIFQLIPLNHIKHFISKEIDELDSKCCKEFYYTKMPMNEIFPSDIIQYILSFGGFYHTKAVSKKWKQYSEQNERNHLTKLYSSIKEIKSPVQYDENMNKTYIIHPNRTKLHKVERAFGYVGPMVDIEKTLKICNSGDRLLVHSGVYDVLEIGDLNIQLIGLGAVTIKFPGDANNVCLIYKETKCDIRNIKFDGPKELIFGVQENATLQLDNCELIGGKYSAVLAEDGSYLNVSNCRFIGGAGIELTLFTKEVNIIDCTFENCGINIGFFADDPDDPDYVESMQLKCVGNVFDVSNSLDPYHPITTDESANYVAQSDRYTLRDNLLKGASGNYEGNPNKIKVIRI